ncbi:MAG: hypothetical protein BWY34_00022 [Parcubacteria group bacterium ADurb.Bin247]|jgi:hypothetical protein|nr:MAG: hypothetical protein BWY34_00022 [Parcubacteria group bacterium ADurb.Bin247]HQB85166.1 hypothetical protein [Candidatus Pacearchaeota archaeon]
MKPNSIILNWFEWYLFDAPLFIIKTFRDIIVFNFDFFSIGFLFKTMFCYWHNYSWSFDRGSGPLNYINVLFGNFISRILGGFVRLLTIIVGVISGFSLFLIGGLVLVFWFLSPIIIIISFVLGITLLW